MSDVLNITVSERARQEFANALAAQGGDDFGIRIDAFRIFGEPDENRLFPGRSGSVIETVKISLALAETDIAVRLICRECQ